MIKNTNVFSSKTDKGSPYSERASETSIVFNVKNFGPISSAEICVGGLTLFVGENNSGKTYLMQLIYGILQALPNISGTKEYMDKPLPNKIDSSNFSIVENIINRWLHENKTKLVGSIFNSDISVDSVNISFKNIASSFSLEELSSVELTNLKERNKSAFGYTLYVNNMPHSKVMAPEGLTGKVSRYDMFIRLIVRHIITGMVSRSMDPALFFPASRSGVLLLYKDVLGKLGSYTIEDMTGNKGVSENPYGITAPLYDFMQFLQTHKVAPSEKSLRKPLVSFINHNLVDGEFGIKNSIISYRSNSAEQWFPAYLSSSMVNEISPLIFLLTSIMQYSYIFYDEIETCFHPSKQIDLARLVVRLVNYGYHMIVSTHSDTMAAAINNLIMLSSTEHAVETAKSLGYTSDDLLQVHNAHIYQFSHNESGTEVKELECYPELGIGYDFELFYKSSARLYKETKAILGGTQ